VKGGLIRRTIVASGGLALLVGAAFAVMVRAIVEERGSAGQATHSEQVLATANQLERVLLDLETGQQGFFASGDPRFLEPWRDAQRDYPALSRELIELAIVPAQDRRARRIAAAIDSYARDYSTPLVTAGLRSGSAAEGSSDLREGRRRVNELRRRFDAFIAAEHRLLAGREERAHADGRRAIVLATVGLAGSVVVIVLFGAYLTRSIAIPVRRAASMAGQLAGGDLATRMPETAVGEIGALERSFNTMARSLETSRDELRMLAEEQAALRRVATLVARAVPSPKVLNAVAKEAAGLLDADYAVLLRYEADGTATSIAGGGDPGPPVPQGTNVTLEGNNVAGAVLRTARPARIDGYEDAAGSIAALVRGRGIRSSVGAPIVVQGRLWGVMIAGWTQDTEQSPDVEARMAQFTELVATAIANAESRAELAASRARLVTTADEARRRLQRDLHDGAQQRLVHTTITLKLARQALEHDGPALELVDEALQHAERATDELRDLSHGILPSALSRGGLRAGVDALVARVQLPVSVDVTAERLSPALEATAYFIVAEALTNIVKHAHAGSAQVKAVVDGGALRLEVRDDGIGGAAADGDSGLLGLHDRATALGGELSVESPHGGGTVIAVTLPVSGPPKPYPVTSAP
jgi:signal transduction histidine kinase